MVDDVSLGCRLHPDVIAPLLALQARAQTDGQQLAVASGFRDFERQQTIWNDKVLGRRPVYDRAGNEVDLDSLDDWDKVQTLLIWSALPGASRHHWGTDLDVFNPQLIPTGGRLELSQAEYWYGAQKPFCEWLDKQLQVNGDFFRPYSRQNSITQNMGVEPEPWHISYRPLASVYEQALTVDLLRDVLATADLQLKDCILANLETIVARYVRTG